MAGRHPGLPVRGSCYRSIHQGENNMLAFIKTWAALRTDRRAVTALEYAMIAGVVVAVIAVGFGVFANDLNLKFNAIGSSI